MPATSTSRWTPVAGIEAVQDLAPRDNLTAAATVIRICARSTLKTKGLGFIR
jgi:hypothetical protein